MSDQRAVGSVKLTPATVRFLEELAGRPLTARDLVDAAFDAGLRLKWGESGPLERSEPSIKEQVGDQAETTIKRELCRRAALDVERFTITRRHTMKRKTLTELRKMNKADLVSFADRLCATNAALEKECDERTAKIETLRQLARDRREGLAKQGEIIAERDKELEQARKTSAELERAVSQLRVIAAEHGTVRYALESLFVRTVHELGGPRQHQQMAQQAPPPQEPSP
jgi:adenine-specific DNA methylase